MPDAEHDSADIYYTGMGAAHEKRTEPEARHTNEVRSLRVLMMGHEWFQERPGGGGRYMQTLGRELAARGHHVTILVPRSATGPLENDTWEGVTVLRLPLGSSAGAWMGHLIRILPAVTRRWGPFDVVHSHFAPIGLVPLWHPVLRSARRICQFQGPWAGESRFEGASPLKTTLQRQIERLAYARCDAFITLSHAFARLLHRDYDIPPRAIQVIPSGIDLNHFLPAVDRAAVRTRLGAAAGPLVFTVRRLVQRMGLEVLLEAWPAVLSAQPQAQLWIAGEGPLRDSLTKQINQLNIGHSVTLLGRIDDERLRACHQAADAFVLPTVALEGFGLVTLEALACGTPVLGTQEGATPELLEPLDPTLLVPAANPPALAQGLVRLLSRADADTLRRACRAHAERHYGWPNAISQVEAVLAGP